MENNPDSLGLLLAEKHAVDEPVIDVTEKISSSNRNAKEEPTAKKLLAKTISLIKAQGKL